MLGLISLVCSLSSAPQMILHLRADTGVVRDGSGRVATWKDLSPRHTNFVTPNFGKPSAVYVTRYHDTASKRVYKTFDSDSLLRPRFLQDGIGRNPAIAFDGAQALADTTYLPLDSGFTLFAVAQDSTGNGFTATLFDKGPGDFNTDLPNGWDDSINGCFNMGLAWVRDFAMSNFETYSPTLYESSWDGKIGSLWANGQFLTSGSGSNPAKRNKATWIGGVANPYNELQNFMTGRISEIRVYPGSLSESDRKTIEDSLKCHYGLDSKACSNGERMILHLRADTGLVLDEAGRLIIWKDLSNRHTNFVTPNLVKPELLFLTHYADSTEKRRYATLNSPSLLRPHLESNCLLGSGPCVRFDGANTLVDTTSLPLDSGFTLFVVAQDSSGPGAFTALVDKGPGDMNTDLWTGIDGNFQMGCGWVKNVAKSTLETAAPTLYESNWDSGRGTIWANGHLEGAGTWDGNATRNKNTWLGAVYNQYPVLMGFLTGRIYEVRIYAGSMTPARRKAIEDSMMAKYGLNLPPPPPPHSEHMIVHLRADTGIVLDANQRVAIWKDLSSRHTDFRTPSLGKPHAVLLTPYHDTVEKRVYKILDADSLLRPRFVHEGIGGYPSVAFDGLQTLVDSSSLPLDSGFTIFIVAQDSTGNGHAATLFDKAPGDFNIGVPNGGDNNISGSFSLGIGWVGSITHSDFQTSLPVLYESSFGDSTGILRANGRLLSSGKWKNPLVRNKSTWLGAVLNYYGELQNFLKGKISEVIVYSGVLDSASRKTTEAALLTRYNLLPTTSINQKATAFWVPTTVIRTGTRFEIITQEFEQATLASPSGQILSRQPISRGRVLLPEFHGAAILSLQGKNRIGETRILTAPR